jgi:hypothetical protein
MCPAASARGGASLGSVLAGIAEGVRVVTSTEDSAGSVVIATGLSAINSIQLTIKNVTSNILKMGDQVLTDSAGTITVADGSTDKVVAGDTIYWLAIGTPAV